jgi:hypothetical protein
MNDHLRLFGEFSASLAMRSVMAQRVIRCIIAIIRLGKVNMNMNPRRSGTFALFDMNVLITEDGSKSGFAISSPLGSVVRIALSCFFLSSNVLSVRLEIGDLFG